MRALSLLRVRMCNIFEGVIIVKQLRKDSQTKDFIEVVRTIVTTGCSTLTPNQRNEILGALRARDFKKLIGIGETLRASVLLPVEPDYSSSVMEMLPKVKEACQIAAAVTKYPYSVAEIPGSDPDTTAINSLKSDEHRNRRLNVIFNGYMDRQRDRHPMHWAVRDVVWKVLGEKPDLSAIYNRCGFTSGASVNFSGNSTHFFKKVRGPWTGTAGVIWHFKNSIRYHDQLRLALAKTVGGRRVEPVCIDDEAIDAYIDSRVTVLNYNKIACVLKNSKTSRTIAKEPELNNWIQSGIDAEMRSLLRKNLNVDLRDQTVNQHMAREGSLPDVCNPYVTIDVKSASNGVFTALARYLLSPEWFTLLKECRSPYGEFPDGTLHRYGLFATMGNGFCFPLESLIFGAICVAASRYTRSPVDFRVYGDDIIVRQNEALVVIELLKSFGFRVNIDKTFIFGPFRESCGADWYSGRLVTPVYLRKRFQSKVEKYILHNQMKEFPEVQRLIRDRFLNGRFLGVPDDKSYDWVTSQACRVPQDVWMTCENARFNPCYHAWTFKLLSMYPVKDREFIESLPPDELEDLGEWGALRGSGYAPFYLRRVTNTHVSGYSAARRDAALLEFAMRGGSSGDG